MLHGLRIIDADLRRRRIECAYVEPMASGKQAALPMPAPDVWLVSCLGHRDWWSLPPLIRKLRTIGGRIVLGGQCADLMGWADGRYCDLRVVGDWSDDAAGAATGGATGTMVSTSQGAIPPPIATSSSTIIHIAHGCHRRCGYCRIGNHHCIHGQTRGSS